MTKRNHHQMIRLRRLDYVLGVSALYRAAIAHPAVDGFCASCRVPWPCGRIIDLVDKADTLKARVEEGR